MVPSSSSSLRPPLDTFCFKISQSTTIITNKLTSDHQTPNHLPQIAFTRKPRIASVHSPPPPPPPLLQKRSWIEKSFLPLAASMAVLLSSYPASAGFLSGFSGIESVPGPELPKFDALTRFNEENQKRYAENDARFKESPLLKELLERSKLNKEKNRQAIQDKYCIRGAEWGVGDCSAEGMTPQERDDFIAMLKKKAGVE